MPFSNSTPADSPSPASSTARLSPPESPTPYSPVSAKRTRDSSSDSHVDRTQEHLLSSDIDDQLENALAAWSDEPDLDLSQIPELPPVEQVKHIEDLEKKPMKEGETWFLVARVWYDQWMQYCRRMASIIPGTRLLGENNLPGPVDNSSIIFDDDLTANIAPSQYVLLPEEAWACLAKWYGKTTALPRKVITVGEYDRQSIVELYPNSYILYIVRSATDPSPLEKCPKISMSRTSTTSDFKASIRNALHLSPEAEFQVWTLEEVERTGLTLTPPFVDVGALSKSEKLDLSKGERTLHDISLGSQPLAVELKNKGSGSYPSDNPHQHSDSSASSTSSSAFANGFNNLTTSSGSPHFSSLTAESSREAKLAPSKPKGVCGLSNLINTCFMNSAIQCLSNTEQLTKWFLAATYKEELNPNNPLGMRGEVAEAYGELIEKLWSGTLDSFPPRDFKSTIGRFNAAFDGYNQHDSQELLAFLLDGLHEDLNRITKKPYIEMPDFDGLSDHEIAQKSWDYHKARNDSIIVDLFQGQYKSKLVCNDCGKVSVTFDPFMYLTLPLPIRKKTRIELVYVPYDPSQMPVSITVTLSQDASIRHLKNEVARMMDVEDATTLLAVEIFSDKIYAVYKDHQLAGAIDASDKVYVYQLPGPVPSGNDASSECHNEDEQLVVFPVYCVSTTASNNATERRSLTQFGGPIVLGIRKKDIKTPEDLYQLIINHLERYAIIKLSEEAPLQNDTPNPIGVMEEVGVSEKNDTIDQNTTTMDVDVVQQIPVDTAAAVTAAGGKRMVPMSNLFSIKVFSDTPIDSQIPAGIIYWDNVNLKDLETGARKEAANVTESVEDNDGNTRAEHAIDEPTTDEPTTDEPTTDKPTTDKSIIDGSSTDQPSNDEPSTDEPFTSEPFIDEPSTNVNIIESQADTDLGNDSMTLDVSISSSDASPLPVISQREGILIEWRLRKAQQVFGVTTSRPDEVDDYSWKEPKRWKNPAMDSEKPQKKRKVTLAHCLDEFTKEEQLGEKDPWYCPRCKEHKPATKKFDLWSLPEILVVHLKRFSQIRNHRDKIDEMIDFPTEALDMTDRALSIQGQDQIAPEDRLLYDLYAVDNHFGYLSGGHYTACARNWNDSLWYNFDDSHVSPMEPSDAKTSAAYLLFYKRRRPCKESSDDDESEHVEIDNVED